MTTPLNIALMRMPRRAEVVDPSILAQTFVNVGPLVNLLQARDHQVLYGRRGTGKTHALLYLASTVESSGDWSLNVDLRQVGSATGVYSDSAIPIAERAGRLLLDTMATVHSHLVDLVLAAAEAEDLDFSAAMTAVDKLADAITQVRVRGNVELTTGSTSVAGDASHTDFTLGSDSIGFSTEPRVVDHSPPQRVLFVRAKRSRPFTSRTSGMYCASSSRVCRISGCGFCSTNGVRYRWNSNPSSPIFSDDASFLSTG